MKHLFNDIPEDEKNRILEMHKNQRDSEMINEQPGKYVAPLVKGVGDVIRTGARALGRTLNPPKVQVIRGHGPQVYRSTPYNKAIANLLDKSGVVKNNQFVQNELGDFRGEMYNVNKIFNKDRVFQNKYGQVGATDNSIGIKNKLDKITELMKAPIGKELNLGWIYENLVASMDEVIKNPSFGPIIGKPMNEAIKKFETSVATILSQAGR